MRIHILSDLHEEFGSPINAEAASDVLILAGDIALGMAGIQTAQRLAAGRRVIYVAGNHEYYGQAIPHLTEKLRGAASASNIHFLEKNAVVIDNVRFLGCTLWTDFRLFGDAQVIASAVISAASLMDFKKIRVSPEFRKLTPKDASIEHRKSVSWLQRELQDKTYPTVVVTHHAPLLDCVRDADRGDLISGAYASDLSKLILEIGPGLWVSGHTHVAVDFVLGTTRVVSNPRGYPDSIVAGFDPTKVVDIANGHHSASPNQ